MFLFEIGVSVAAAVILFTYALKGFGEDIRRIGGEELGQLLGRLTRNRFHAFLLGAAITALVQSSSAISGLAVALVQAGTVTFRGSLPVFLGANVGTTSTAWLMSIDVALLGPLLIVISVALSILPGRVALFGRSIFYLGVVLLALRLISDYVAPLKTSPEVAEWLAHARNPVFGLMLGVVGTALLQSSSVLVGLAVVAVQQDLLQAGDVIPIVLGSNIGTTSTALLASIQLGGAAQRAALANFIFNAVGVAIFLPFLDPFSRLIYLLAGNGTMAVATTHLLFNIGVAISGFLIANIVADRLEKHG